VAQHPAELGGVKSQLWFERDFNVAAARSVGPSRGGQLVSCRLAVLAIRLLYPSEAASSALMRERNIDLAEPPHPAPGVGGVGRRRGNHGLWARVPPRSPVSVPSTGSYLTPRYVRGPRCGSSEMRSRCEQSV
jgi:hypothetical protein